MRWISLKKQLAVLLGLAQAMYPPPPPPPARRPPAAGTAKTPAVPGPKAEAAAEPKQDGTNAKDRRGIAFKDRVQSLESVIQSSYGSLQAQVDGLAKQITDGQKELKSVMEQKQQAELRAAQVEHELHVKDLMEKTRNTHNQELSAKDKLLESFRKANEDFLRENLKLKQDIQAHETQQTKVQNEKKELERQNRVAKSKLEDGHVSLQVMFRPSKLPREDRKSKARRAS